MKISDVQPPHCYARARRLLGEIDLVRAEMGRSADTRPLPEVVGAAPRECYFEAIGVWAKADRLNQELTGDPCDALPPGPALAEVRPGHVLALIDAALREVDLVKHALGMAEKAPEMALEDRRQPSDVLATLIEAGRALGRLLERPFTPSDVYRQVALASVYAGRLVERAGGSAPAAARFERGKRPTDCYQKLLGCLDLLRELARKAGQTTLEVRGVPPEVLPGDVYDVASLVLGEVVFLHGLAADPAPPLPFASYAPGRRLPAHVYQEARTLEALLTTAVAAR